MVVTAFLSGNFYDLYNQMVFLALHYSNESCLSEFEIYKSDFQWSPNQENGALKAIRDWRGCVDKDESVEEINVICAEEVYLMPSSLTNVLVFVKDGAYLVPGHHFLKNPLGET